MNPNPESRTLDLLRRNPKVKGELLERLGRASAPELARLGVTNDALSAFVEGRRRPGLESGIRPGGEDARGLEAIVRRFGRPVLLIQNGTYQAPELPSVAEQLAPHKSRIERAIARVGRVEFRHHPMPWGGTGWLVDRNVVITNRHVAEIVAEADGHGAFRFRISPAGVSFGARLDFKEEHGIDGARELELTSVRYVARSDQPDIALLEIEVDGELPEPIELSDEPLNAGRLVGVIGYPAYDSRNDADDIARYFGDIFDVKRLAPGEVSETPEGTTFFMHDATTLGGNSGSVVLGLESGKAVGLHFAGSYLIGNYAVTSAQIKRALQGLKTTVVVPEEITSNVERADGTHSPSHFEGRSGYDRDFLGDGALRVPMPGLGKWDDDAARVAVAGGGKSPILTYTHFSVAFSTSRKVPIYTAVNIDGGEARRIKRGDDQWFCDLRLPRDIQLTRRDYDHGQIDRGHMVRREDPNWGTAAVAQLANDDTFHYTNAAPQHARLNQGKAQWLGLEDYVLGSARTHGLRISVITGPVLRKDDRALENGVKVPEEFWKIVAAVGSNGKLRTTGYVLSQGKLIEDITESFVYGQYRTYQVPIKAIAKATGLDFGPLADADALKKVPAPEGVPESIAMPFIPLDDLESMVL